MKILLLGDVVGKIGRKAVAKIVPGLREEHGIDLVIANAENLAHGHGITQNSLNELLEGGVDFCTSGNHIFAKGEGLEILAKPDSPVIRPANYPPGWPGVGQKVLTIGTKSVLVINLLGRLFMKVSPDCPFRTVDAILKSHSEERFDAIIVDFHAEATSEKKAFGFYCDGRVSAVVGTHTHTPAADEQILPKGTAYTTDLGFVGAKYSVLGFEPESGILAHLQQSVPKAIIPESGMASLCGVLVTVDDSTGQSTHISRIYKEVEI